MTEKDLLVVVDGLDFDGRRVLREIARALGADELGTLAWLHENTSGFEAKGTA